ncbi:hypothetical protein TD95_001904 [Thielaviopsis punctulata]|uniref:Prefoldin subunit 5 n=1 Tax=Thielaviopsis punctulata TaxID=72032 RepID=A0A0F4ZI60_9PEZI|nr:hypothetical protein TD95_001904 [Thielaviopsis punctulata]
MSSTPAKGQGGSYKTFSFIHANHPSLVSIDSLDIQQLAMLKKQITEDLEHLSASFTSLNAAHAKFKESLRCVQARANAPEEAEGALVPLTTSLYVRGTLTDKKRVLIDIGTGFLVEKSLPDAIKYYEAKTTGLTKSLQELEGVITSKTLNVQAVEETLRQKMMAAQAAQSTAQTA